MVPLRYPTWTPVKIRGKRHSTRAEEANSAKRRKPKTGTHGQNDGRNLDISREFPLPRARKRKQREREWSPLECLPAEVLQLVFEYSRNLALPIISRQIASKLTNSKHLRVQMTSLFLRPVLKQIAEKNIASPADLALATRLLNARFMTWNFFRSWLLGLPEIWASMRYASDEPSTYDLGEAWLALQPALNLLPPRKLLSPPFTEDKTSFLAVLAQNVHDLSFLDPPSGEVAYEGLVAAVLQAKTRVVSLILGMGLKPSNDLLRTAAAGAGCDGSIVRMLSGENALFDNDDCLHTMRSTCFCRDGRSLGKTQLPD